VPQNWKAELSSSDQATRLDSTTSASMASSTITVPWLRWFTYIAIAAGGTIADLWTKDWVFKWRGLPGELPPWWLIEPYVGIETAVNPGALFGMGAGWGKVFAFLSLLAAAAILLWLSKFKAIASWWLVVALGSVTGGIFGNLYDRLGLWNPPADHPAWRSGVRDWILFRYEQFTWPNFNIADSLLVCGAIMLAIHSFLMAQQENATAREATAKDPSLPR
jgi:signal peptidase II